MLSRSVRSAQIAVSLALQNKLPYKSISIVDGDTREEYLECISLPKQNDDFQTPDR